MQDDKTKQQENKENEETGEAVEQAEVSQQEVKEEKSKPVKIEDKKIAKLTKALEKAEEEKDAFKDSYQRTFSEFNNFKKRNQGAVGSAMKDGASDAVAQILPVLDNFERALEHAEDQKNSAFADGVSMVYKQLVDILTSMEVSEIPSLGEQFDPNVHHAIQQIEVEESEAAPNTVVMVVQKGYMLGEKILRHSMVIVSK